MPHQNESSTLENWFADEESSFISCYLLCSFKLFAMYSGALKTGCALEWKGETDRVYVIPELLRLVSWSFETWTGHVCPVSPPAYPDLCGLSRHNVGFHIFYPPLNIPRLCYRKAAWIWAQVCLKQNYQGREVGGHFLSFAILWNCEQMFWTLSKHNIVSFHSFPFQALQITLLPIRVKLRTSAPLNYDSTSPPCFSLIGA